MSELDTSSVEPVISISSPHGGESIFERQITVQWQPNVLPDTYFGGFYEIFYTDNYRLDEENDWRIIGTAPFASSSYQWVLPNGLYSDRCRLSIRVRFRDASWGRMSVSPGDFAIRRKIIHAPTFVSPLSNSHYEQVVPIVFDSAAIRNSASRNAYYYVFYDSEKKGIDWRQIGRELRVGETLFWDVSVLPSSNDYRLRAFLVDGVGNRSKGVFVNNISIGHKGRLIVDTVAPQGSIVVANRQQYVRERDVILQLFAIDELTGVASAEITETNVTDNTTTNSEEPHAQVKSWTLSENDGRKRLQAVFTDNAGNKLSSSVYKYARTYFDVNAEIIDIVKLTDDIYVLVSGSSPALYQGQNIWLTLSDTPTAMEVYSGTIYIGTRNSINRGKLSIVSGSDIIEAIEFTSNDSSINAMEVIDTTIYMGLQNGMLYSYDGTSFTLLTTFGFKIATLVAKDDVLIIGFENSSDIYVYDGMSFVLAEVLNGS